MGHIARAEAVVAAAQGKFEAAYQQFNSAAEIYRRYQVPFEEAEILHYWGRALLMDGKRVQALERLDAATELYQRHGAGERWIESVNADRLRVQSALTTAGRAVVGASASEPLTRSENPSTREHRQGQKLTGVFRRQGEYWTLSWSGSESRLKHRKGMHYIARLLHYPGQEFASQALVFAIEPASDNSRIVSASATDSKQTHTNIVRGVGDAGAMLDARAKAQYQRRLEDLRDELEIAEQGNDLDRAGKTRAEIEFIEREIAAAVGLGGGDRKSASHAERARLAVTKAIKAALNHIRNADPELARHLNLSIQTGYFCAYHPSELVAWQL
jgi:tetratricopeptide (TPR) repeat protein